MKRFLAIPLMFIYLLAMSGMVISTHYCGSRLVSWNVYLKAALCGGCEKDDCGNEGRKKPMKCCKDKIMVAKVQQDQNHDSQFKFKPQAAVFSPAVMPQYYSNDIAPAVSATAMIHRSNAPPGNWQYIPLYKLHSRLTYYG